MLLLMHNVLTRLKLHDLPTYIMELVPDRHTKKWQRACYVSGCTSLPSLGIQSSLLLALSFTSVQHQSCYNEL